MKNEKSILKKSILLYTVIFLILFFISESILMYFGYTYITWVYVIPIIVAILGVILGTIQIIKNLKVSNKIKCIIYAISLVIESVAITVFLVIVFFLYAIMPTTDIVVRDNVKMAREVHSFLLSNGIYYYEYKNMFIRGNKVQIEDKYDNTLSKSEYMGTLYYDEKGNIAKEDINLIDSEVLPIYQNLYKIENNIVEDFKQIFSNIHISWK